MSMPLKAKQEIQREAFFLEKVGYRKTEDENSISYAQNELVFLISFLPNSEESDIMIHFKKENQSFSVGWIALVREGIKGDGEKTKNVIQLLRYIESHYNLITDFQYCLHSNVLIDAYVKQHQALFEKSVSDFWKRHKWERRKVRATPHNLQAAFL